MKASFILIQSNQEGFTIPKGAEEWLRRKKISTSPVFYEGKPVALSVGDGPYMIQCWGITNRVELKDGSGGPVEVFSWTFLGNDQDPTTWLKENI